MQHWVTMGVCGRFVLALYMFKRFCIQCFKTDLPPFAVHLLPATLIAWIGFWNCFYCFGSIKRLSRFTLWLVATKAQKLSPLLQNNRLSFNFLLCSKRVEFVMFPYGIRLIIFCEVFEKSDRILAITCGNKTKLMRIYYNWLGYS